MSHHPSPEIQPPTPWVDPDLPRTEIDYDLPSWAGVVDYYLYGGRNNRSFAHWVVDREYAGSILGRFPSEQVSALQHRLFLHRAVRYMSGKSVEQFIDLGSGLAGPYSTHEVVDTLYREEAREPAARVCYVENHRYASASTMVLLDRQNRPRRHVMVEGDLRRPDELLTEIGYEELINFDEPVGVIVTGTMQLEQHDRQGQEVGPEALRRFAGQMAPGSYLAVSHVTNESRIPGDETAAEILEGIRSAYNSSSIGAVAWRSRAEIESLAGDYRPVEGGWTAAELWGQDYTGANAPYILPPPASYPLVWAGVGLKG